MTYEHKLLAVIVCYANDPENGNKRVYRCKYESNTQCLHLTRKEVYCVLTDGVWEIENRYLNEDVIDVRQYYSCFQAIMFWIEQRMSGHSSWFVMSYFQKVEKMAHILNHCYQISGYYEIEHNTTVGNIAEKMSTKVKDDYEPICVFDTLSNEIWTRIKPFLNEEQRVLVPFATCLCRVPMQRHEMLRDDDAVNVKRNYLRHNFLHHCRCHYCDKQKIDTVVTIEGRTDKEEHYAQWNDDDTEQLQQRCESLVEEDERQRARYLRGKFRRLHNI